jgi:hypothetical protein
VWQVRVALITPENQVGFGELEDGRYNYVCSQASVPVSRARGVRGAPSGANVVEVDGVIAMDAPRFRWLHRAGSHRMRAPTAADGPPTPDVARGKCSHVERLAEREGVERKLGPSVVAEHDLHGIGNALVKQLAEALVRDLAQREPARRKRAAPTHRGAQPASLLH